MPLAASEASGGADGFTSSDRKTLLDFLLAYNMGKQVVPGVTALITVHDNDCAVRLVVDAYHVPQPTAELFVRLLARPDGSAAATGR